MHAYAREAICACRLHASARTGRLDDHINNTAGVREMLGGLAVLVMDEADQLLDHGFRPSLVKILAMLPPPETRQTLLVSRRGRNPRPTCGATALIRHHS